MIGNILTFETRGQANDSIDRKIRYQQIIEILKDNKEPMSAKEIAVEMRKRGYAPTSERNFASPRLTELLRNGTIDIFGKKKCEYTGKTVCVFGLRN